MKFHKYLFGFCFLIPSLTTLYEAYAQSCNFYPTGNIDDQSNEIFEESGRLSSKYNPGDHFPTSITDHQENKTYPIPKAIRESYEAQIALGKPIFISAPKKDGKVIQIFNLKTGKQSTVQLPQDFTVKQIQTVELSPDESHLVYETRSGLVVQQIDNPKSHVFYPGLQLKSRPTESSNFSATGGWLLAKPIPAEMEIIERSMSSETPPEKLIQIDLKAKKPLTQKILTFPNTRVSLQGSTLAWIGDDGSVHLKNLVSQAEKTFPKPETLSLSVSESTDVNQKVIPIPRIAVLNQGKQLAIGYPKGGIQLHNVNSGKTTEITTSPFDEMKTSWDGKHLVLINNHRLQSIDLATGAVSTISTDQIENYAQEIGKSSVLPNGMVAIPVQDAAGMPLTKKVPFKGVCVQDPIIVQFNPPCPNDPTPAPLVNAQWFQEIISQDLCRHPAEPQTPSELAQWRKLAPPNGNEKISEDSAKKLLLRFQRFQGFNPSEDLPSLLGILRSPIVQLEPELVLGALQTVNHQSTILYFELLSKFPELNKLAPKRSAQECRSAKELKQVTEDGLKLFSEIKRVHGAASKYSDWEPLSAYSQAFKSLPQEQKDAMIDQVADSLSALAKQAEFRVVFASKIYKFSYQAAAPLFGERRKSMTDLTLVRRYDGQLEPVILSTEVIDQNSATQTQYGYYSKNAPALNPKTLFKADDSERKYTHQWKLPDGDYQAELLLRPIHATDLVEVAPKPRYDELWKDGTLSGIIFTGTNLQDHEHTIMDQYLAYYQSKGFRFSAKKTTIPDFTSYLQGKIQSGEADYLIKEAHSDGDERNAFRISRAAEALEGELLLPDGRKEIIQLIYSVGEPQNSRLISNHEFGEWVRARESQGQGQLVYFNTSCWGISQATDQIIATKSKLLLTFAAKDTVEIFGNEAADAEQILLTAFREGQSYDTFRSRLEQNSKYKRGEGNHFIFPDDSEFSTEVIHRLIDTADAKIMITGPDGKPYTIDQQH